MWNFDLTVKMKSYFLISSSQKFVKTVEKESVLINELVFDSLYVTGAGRCGQDVLPVARATRAIA